MPPPATRGGNAHPKPAAGGAGRAGRGVWPQANRESWAAAQRRAEGRRGRHRRIQRCKGRLSGLFLRSPVAPVAPVAHGGGQEGHSNGARQGANCADRKAQPQRGPIGALLPPAIISFRSGAQPKASPREKGGLRPTGRAGGKRAGAPKRQVSRVGSFSPPFPTLRQNGSSLSLLGFSHQRAFLASAAALRRSLRAYCASSH